MRKITGWFIVLFTAVILMTVTFVSVFAINEGFTEEKSGYVLYLKDSLTYSKKALFEDLKTAFDGTSLYSYSIDEGESKITRNSSGDIDFISGKIYAVCQFTTGIWEEADSFKVQLFFTPLLKIDGHDDMHLEVMADDGKNTGTVELTIPAKSGYNALITVGGRSFTVEESVDGIHRVSLEISSSDTITVEYQLNKKESVNIKGVSVSGNGTVSAPTEGYYPEGIYTITAIPSLPDYESEGYYVSSIRINGDEVSVDRIVFDSCTATASVMLEKGKEYFIDVDFEKISLEFSENPDIIFEPDNYDETELKAEIIKALSCSAFDLYKDNIIILPSEGFFFATGKINVDVVCLSDGRYPYLAAKNIPVTLFQCKKVNVTFFGENSAEYNGECQGFETVVKDEDGKYYTNGETVIRYVSTDGVYNGTVAPKDVGKYNVTAVYKEYDANGNLIAEGAGETTLEILPAEISLKIKDKEKYVYQNDPEFEWETAGLPKGEQLENLVLSREKGNKAGVYKIYATFDENRNYKVSVEVGALTISHEPGKLMIDKGIPAGCENEGLTEGSHCECCDEIFVPQNKVPPKGHNYVSRVTRSAACTDKGIITYSCTQCGSKYTKEISALGHSYSLSYTVDKKATYSEEGSKSKHCTHKGCTAKISVKSIPVLDLAKVKGVKVESTASSLKVCWKKVKGAEKYMVELLNSKGKIVKTVTVKKTAYTFKKLSKANVYKIRVRAVANKNKGSYSTLITTSTAPAGISKLSLKSVKANTASVSWNKITGASGYEVQYSVSKKMKSVNTVTVKKAKTTKITLKKLKSKKAYYIRVRAYKSVGNKKVYGVWSSVKNIRIK